ncbi:MAG: D-alanyl-D-alanine carboxypeptidase/D-alanyl-D-alanine-endopeptidase [Sedimentisphaerales bacterium]|nr:D-alanyl-D-alanine carboxypeptidase/D-alanyl-D-alanine-endopeptidase [Sedimentisphaerales bacterium]
MYRIMRKGFVATLVVAALMGLYFAPDAQGSLTGRIRAITGSARQRNTQFGIQIIHANSGQILYSRNARIPMIPASNMKAVISSAALHYLGPEYHFTTQVGLLDDSLVVLGYGDPLLGDEKTDLRRGRTIGWIFDDIVVALKERNTFSLKHIYVDGTFFDDQPLCDNWPPDQLNRWYCAEISGLNYNNNCVKVNVKRTESQVDVVIEPYTRFLSIINQVSITNSGSSAVEALRTTTPNKVIVKGKCRQEAGFDLAIERPAAFFGVLLYERLRKEGISITGNLAEKYVRHEKGIEIIRTYQTPIKDVLMRCNKNSLGMAAECLVKTISAENTIGRINGQWEHGLDLVGRYLESLHVATDEFRLDDGSGLSRENRLSPHALTAVLSHEYNSKNWPVYRSSLAIGGIDGTIDGYFQDSKYQGRIIGKTGYIDGVRTFSGYCFTGDGTFIFSILTEGGNGYTRADINAMVEAIIDETE